MSGVPVIVAGSTHYREKGFTLDPDTWETFSNMLDRSLNGTHFHRLSHQQVESAWNYAYRFFFEYPLPFPWHLLYVQEGLQEWSIERTLSPQGLSVFGDTFRHLVGEPRQWDAN